MRDLENCDKGEDAVQECAGIGNQWLLVIHEQGCHKELGG
jgi:hypothetical protein